MSQTVLGTGVVRQCRLVRFNGTSVLLIIGLFGVKLLLKEQHELSML